MRALTIVFIFLTTIYAQIIEPEQAFKTSFEEKDNVIKVKVELAQDIYLYADQVKVKLRQEEEKIDVTSQLQLPKAKQYDDFMIYAQKLEFDIPNMVYKDAGAIELSFQGCSKAGICYAPVVKSFQLVQQKQTSSTPASQTDEIVQKIKDSNFIMVLATFFGIGVLLSLTPCVFPMVPILSSIIVSYSSSGHKMSAKKGFFLSLVYVLAMSIAYTIAGVFAGLFGSNLQAALQNPFILVVFAVIFVALAISMFGYYKLELPQSIQNKINKKAEGKKGVKGVAIMGFLSALIVGPCVAPPLAGALVYIGQTGDALLGGSALFVMSIGMGLPLLVLGAGAGKFMPKPGGWMESVSKIFGVIMLGLAIWILERVMPSIITMLLWGALLVGSALYLKAHHLKKFKIKKIFGLILGIYGLLIIAGAFSGATSPLNPLKPYLGTQVKALDFKEVQTIHELQEIVKSTEKIVMIDFTASWCVNCKELKEITFADKRVQNELKNYLLLKVDVSDNSDEDKALMKKFNIYGPPALIFYKEGKLMDAKIVGYIAPKKFLEYINVYIK